MRMEVRWSTLAAEDLERIFRRIEKNNPTAARKTVKAIYDGCRALSRFPHSGPPWTHERTARAGLFPLHRRLPSQGARR
jgi:plasmid stabilization system protein ParE